MMVEMSNVVKEREIDMGGCDDVVYVEESVNNMYIKDCFFFNYTATTEIYTLSLHDALPIWSPEAAPSFCCA